MIKCLLHTRLGKCLSVPRFLDLKKCRTAGIIKFALLPCSLFHFTHGQPKRPGPAPQEAGRSSVCLGLCSSSPPRLWKWPRAQLAFHLQGPSSSGLLRGNSLLPHPPFQPPASRASGPRRGCVPRSVPLGPTGPQFLHCNLRVRLGHLTALSFHGVVLNWGWRRGAGMAMRNRPEHPGWGKERW